MANWANLPRDLVAAIAQKMVLIEDFIAIGAVCKSWNLAVTKKAFSITDQVPFLMVEDKGTGGGINGFYSLKKGKLLDNLNLPEEAKDKWCFSSLGWLLVQSEQDLKVNLLHPLTNALVELPHTLKSEHINFKVRKFVLSASPSCSSNYVVMVLYRSNSLAFWRPNDYEWSTIDEGKESGGSYYLDVTHHLGQFYVVDSSVNLIACDIQNPNEPKARVVSQFPRRAIRSVAGFEKIYLVGSEGDLFMVFRFGKQVTRGFGVYVMPLNNEGRSLEVINLVNRSLFLGTNSSFSIDTMDCSRCKANCIYFTNDLHGGQCTDMGIFNLITKNVVPHLGEGSRFPTPCLWIQPSF